VVGPLLLLLGALGPRTGAAPAPVARTARDAGVVIEGVGAAGVCPAAQLQAGDLVLAWERRAASGAAAASGSIRSPFDLAGLEDEQVPLGAVVLRGRRRGRPFTAALPPCAIRGRPSLPLRLLASYRRGTALLGKQQAQGAARLWTAAASALDGGGAPTACWLLHRAGEAHAREGDAAAVAAVYRIAVERARRGQDAGLAAWLLAAEAEALAGIPEPAQAAEALDAALRGVEAEAAESLAAAGLLCRLGRLAHELGQAPRSEALYRRSLEMRERLAPGRPAAMTLTGLGLAALLRGDIEAAESLQRRALAAAESRGPATLEVAHALTNLGGVAGNRGRIAEARDLHARALALRERLAPGSLEVIKSLINLGGMATMGGDLPRAEDLYRRALALADRLQPASAREREAAAAAVNNLGTLAQRRGDPAAAEGFYRRALELEERRAPGGLGAARSLTNLASVRLLQGDEAEARRLAERALELYAAHAQQEHPYAAISLSTLGELAAAARDWPAAERYHLRALAIRRRLGLGGEAESRSLYNLSVVARSAGDLPRAVELLGDATAALEQHRGRLGGAEEARSAFAALYVHYYRELTELLLEAGRPAEAFDVLERSRGRSFLAMLAERDAAAAAEIPPEPRRELDGIDREYDRTQARLAALSPARDAAEADALWSRLRELRERREAVWERIRKASPRRGTPSPPPSLGLAAVREVLDGDTVLLSFSVGRRQSHLFVVHPAGSALGGASGLGVFRIDRGEQRLREQVEAFRRLVRRGAGATPEPLAAQARALYDALLGAAEAEIAPHQRVLIAPDGPLHALPFAALLRPSRNGEPAQYLAEWKPLRVTVSPTVYAELKRSRPDPGAPPRPVQLVAFGDPKYPRHAAGDAAPSMDPEVRRAVERGRLDPLPATRAEVEAIAALYPGAATVYLGADATEERAKGVGREARYLHFACHAYLDERFPLNSGLVLALPGPASGRRENGLLQAWEILETARLDADLVTLSACDTALGREAGGEGLLGLARAFQYAGARSVLASLWGVPDDSTSGLMARFYGALRQGRPKDEALQAAQQHMIRSGGPASHPFRWAAFQLIGDWR